LLELHAELPYLLGLHAGAGCNARTSRVIEDVRVGPLGGSHCIDNPGNAPSFSFRVVRLKEIFAAGQAHQHVTQWPEASHSPELVAVVGQRQLGRRTERCGNAAYLRAPKPHERPAVRARSVGSRPGGRQLERSPACRTSIGNAFRSPRGDRQAASPDCMLVADHQTTLSPAASVLLDRLQSLARLAGENISKLGFGLGGSLGLAGRDADHLADGRRRGGGGRLLATCRKGIIRLTDSSRFVQFISRGAFFVSRPPDSSHTGSAAP
jgi:hypothetical protein